MHDLRNRLEALANEGSPRGADLVFAAAVRSIDGVPALPTPSVPGRRARRPVLVGFAIVVVLAAVASSLVLLQNDSGSPSNLVPVVPDENPLRELFVAADPRPGAPTLHLVPEFLPGGMQPVEIIPGDSRPPGWTSGGSEQTQVWVDLDDRTGRPVRSFRLQWRNAADAVWPQPADGDRLSRFRRGSRPVRVRGFDGVYQARRPLLAWQEGDGPVVSIESESLSRAELLAIAKRLRSVSSGFEVTAAPRGFFQVSDMPGLWFHGTNERSLAYRDPTGRGLRIQVRDDDEEDPGQALEFAFPHHRDLDRWQPRVVEVRGHPAVAARYPTSASYGALTMFMRATDQVVRWLEPGGTSVTVSGVGLRRAQVLEVARSLRRVDADRWNEVVARAPGRNGNPPSDLAGLPIPFRGTEKDVAELFTRWLRSTRDVDATVRLTRGGRGVRDAIAAFAASPANPERPDITIDAVRMMGPDRAHVEFSVVSDRRDLRPHFGNAVRVDGRWRVSRATFCRMATLADVQCPPR